jgi:hypothetical protein
VFEQGAGSSPVKKPLWSIFPLRSDYQMGEKSIKIYSRN